jgi:hypothetical protein
MRVSSLSDDVPGLNCYDIDIMIYWYLGLPVHIARNE